MSKASEPQSSEVSAVFMPGRLAAEPLEDNEYVPKLGQALAPVCGI